MNSFMQAHLTAAIFNANDMLSKLWGGQNRDITLSEPLRLRIMLCRAGEVSL